jgi:hypothetical protein
MLAQLVCLDRRYQRMNCFNMRELQALLKEKYYPDLITSFDYRSSMITNINLRHKTNDINLINPKSSLFLNYNLTTSTFLKVQNFNTGGTTDFSSFLSKLNLSYYALIVSPAVVASLSYSF